MLRGKLYISRSEQSVVDIDYVLRDKAATGWWGEFLLMEYRRLSDGEGYVIELEDGRKGRCSIQKRVNRAVTGVPALYRYYFRGSGRLK